MVNQTPDELMIWLSKLQRNPPATNLLPDFVSHQIFQRTLRRLLEALYQDLPSNHIFPSEVWSSDTGPGTASSSQYTPSHHTPSHHTLSHHTPSYHTPSHHTPSHHTHNGTSIPLQTVSPRYRGNRFAPQNQSAAISENQSTSVWITGLPLECSHRELLRAVRNVGKVYATVINPPQDGHKTPAAKIVFFDVEGKDRLIHLAHTGSFVVNDVLPFVISNRIRTASRPPGPECRVLILDGPTHLVEERNLCKRLKGSCTFELEYVRVVSHRGLTATMEWAFGSYRCQAERVYNMIQEESAKAIGDPFNAWGDVTVSWGQDPCDRVWPNIGGW